MDVLFESFFLNECCQLIVKNCKLVKIKNIYKNNDVTNVIATVGQVLPMITKCVSIKNHCLLYIEMLLIC